jgi:uncharacterized membrane protein
MKKDLIDFISDKLTYLNGGTYSNKNDPNFLVPKASPGNGYRLNFGNPKAVISFILMIIVMGILIIGSILISKK